MDSRIHVITLAVSNLDRALAFYREGLGLGSAGITGTDFAGDNESPAGDVAMFHLEGDLILALYPRTELAKDAGVPLGPAQSCEFSIGQLVPSKQDVDTLLAQAEAAGVGPGSQAEFDEAVRRMATRPQSEDRTSRSPSRDGSSGR